MYIYIKTYALFFYWDFVLNLLKKKQLSPFLEGLVEALTAIKWKRASKLSFVDVTIF